MTHAGTLDPRLLSLLACPRDHSELRIEGDRLCCERGDTYPVVGGVPVFLLREQRPTIGIATASLHAAETGAGKPLYTETLGLSETERRGVESDWSEDAGIDSAVSYLIAATSGRGYENLIGRLDAYPIPDIPIERGNGELLLDIGSNWGRWSVSAARKGWRVIAIEPSLGAVMAAQRAFRKANLDIAWICGDARFLPFRPNIFRCAFSYSVLQHFSESDAALAVAEIGRVLRQGGFAKIQMAHRGGLRSTYSRRHPKYLDGGSFRVRYWSLKALRALFEQEIGATRLLPEGFGGLCLLAEDRDIVSATARTLIRISSVLKKASAVAPAFIRVADSVYVVSTKR